MSNDPALHIIYLTTQMLLSKKRYSDWRQIQDEFADYTTSLGPCTATEVLEYLHAEYPSSPITREHLKNFLDSDDETIVA